VVRQFDYNEIIVDVPFDIVDVPFCTNHIPNNIVDIDIIVDYVYYIYASVLPCETL
jgi:hypothetical protein